MIIRRYNLYIEFVRKYKDILKKKIDIEKIKYLELVVYECIEP